MLQSHHILVPLRSQFCVAFVGDLFAIDNCVVVGHVDLIVALNVSEVMVQVSMTGRISSRMDHYVAETGILRQLVVLYGLLVAGLHAGTLRQVSLVDLLQQDSVRVHDLLLYVAH